MAWSRAASGWAVRRAAPGPALGRHGRLQPARQLRLASRALVGQVGAVGAGPSCIAASGATDVLGGRVAWGRRRFASKKKGGRKQRGAGSARPAGAGKGGRKAQASRGGSGGGGGNAGGGVPGEFVFGVEGLSKVLPGGRPLFNEVTLSFLQGAKIGVLGPNGVGKSTLLKAIAKIDEDVDGKVWHREGLRVGYLAQEPQLDAAKDVHGNIMDGLKEKTDLLRRFDAISEAMGDPDADFDALLEEQAAVQTRIDEFDCWNLDHLVAQAKTALRVPPDDADVTKLSGGERRRVALCRLLLEQPEVLMLDEPTNHLDASSVFWLERFLSTYKGTVIAITHDRYFLDNVAGWILELEGGNAYTYQGNYSFWLEQKQQRLDLANKHDAKRQKAMAGELAWIRQGAKGRQSKSKARIKAYERETEADARKRAVEKFLGGSIVIPPGPRLGNVVLDIEGLSHAVGGKTLFDDLTFSVPRGAIVGVVGGNGVGKSTLMGLIVGDTTPDSGSVTLGETVKIGLVQQARSDLNDRRLVHEEIADGQDTVTIGDREVAVRAYMSSFNLTGPVQQKRVGDLSGGERNRVHLAKTLKHACNLLLLECV